MKLNPGDIISNRYEIIEVLGNGGMAIVYKATDLKLDRFVTFKVMREEYTTDEEFIKRFEIEARSAARLSHPNIVNVYDDGNQDLIYYIVMEYIDGRNLKEMIEKKAPFDNEEILGISIQIAEALKNAHNNKIIHRDIKPENIMVTHKGVVKVTDFGIARAVSSATVAVDSTIGSVYYFSPEQARGGFVDVKSDIYSLGIVMFEMATNELPYEGGSAVAIALKHLNNPLPNIKDKNENISNSILKIIKKATEKISMNRYENMDAMLDDLQKALTDSSGKFVKSSNTKLSNKQTVKLSDDDVKKIRSKNIEQKEDNDYDDYNKDSKSKKKPEKVTIVALITSLIIIFIISIFVIRYMESLKPKPVELTELSGMQYQVAQNILLSLDLVPEVITQEHDTIPEGQVISVDVGDEEVLYPTYKVVLVVSTGKPLFEVKKYTSRVYKNDVESELKELGILYDLKEENSPSTPTGIVMRQDPAPKTQITKDQKIEIVVSKGPKETKIEVPDYFKKLPTEAENSAIALGLTLGETQYVKSGTVDKGLIVSQTLKAGATVDKKTEIVFYVSEGPDIPVDTSPKTSEYTIKGIDFLERENLDLEESVRLKVTARKDGITTLVIDKYIKAKEFPYDLKDKNTGVVEYKIEIYYGNEGFFHSSDGPIDFDNLGGE